MVVVVDDAAFTVVGSKRVALLGGCAVAVRDFFGSWYNVLFVRGDFFGCLVVLAEDLSGSYSSSDSSYKALLLVGSLSRNRCIVMLGLDV